MEFETLKGENHPEPSLAEMVQTAIDVLQRNDEGYLLVVEGR